MNEYLFIISIAIALFVGAIVPGPSFLIVAKTALSKSRTHGVVASIGMGVGALIYALIASFGLFFVLETIPWLYTTLKLIGGAYLCYLACKLWIQAEEPAREPQKAIKELNYYKSFLLGLFIQLSNPKTAIWFGGVFIAFLPSVVPNYSYVLLGLTAFIVNTAWYSIIAVSLTTKPAQLLYVNLKKYIDRTASGIMTLLGTKLAFDQ